MDDRKIRCQTKKNICFVNENFFAEWSPEMAYVLGFFAADGCISKNATRQNYYLDFTSTDLDVLEKIKSAMQAEQKISKRERNERWNLPYRIQIGSKKLFYDLYKIGFTPNKSKTLTFPNVPNKYLSDFIRGFFDGDGYSNFCFYYARDRRKMRKTLCCGFASGSELFLRELRERINKLSGANGGTICTHSNNFTLSYSIKDTGKLFNFMYNNLSKKVYLERKYLKFKTDIQKYGSVA